MSFSELPLLPFQLVVEEAVASGALCRALRLRLVSRAFDIEVCRALFRSDAIVDHRHVSLSRADHRFLSRLVTARVRRDRSRRLLLTRAIAGVVELVEAEFGPLPDAIQHDYVAALCEAFAWGPRGNGHGTLVIARYISPPRPSDRSHLSRLHVTPAPLPRESLLHGALVAALSTNDEDKVRRLLEMGADPKKDDLPFNRPIDSVARRGLVPMLEILLASGVELTPTRLNSQFSHIMAAAEYGHESAVKYLLDLFPWSVSSSSESMNFWNYLRVAMLSAVRYGHTKIVTQLLDTVDRMASLDPHHEIFRQRNCTWAPSTLQEAFYEACRCGREDIVRIAVARGALLNRCNGWTHPGIHPATRHGHIGVLKLLVSLGAELAPEDKSSRYSQTLCVAAKLGHVEVVQFWLDRGMDVNNRDNSRTPLLEAARCNEAPMVRLLLSRGVDLEEKDCGRRALHWSCNIGFVDIVEVLLQHGVDPNACLNPKLRSEEDFCSETCTPMLHAKLGGQKTIAELLERYGAEDVDVVRTGALEDERMERYREDRISQHHLRKIIGLAGIR